MSIWAIAATTPRPDTPRSTSPGSAACRHLQSSANSEDAATVEPVIGHLKSDGLLERNHLAGQHGDAINLTLAAAGHNLRLILAWMRCLCALIVIGLIARPIKATAT